jgi:polyamine:H+ symporter
MEVGDYANVPTHRILLPYSGHGKDHEEGKPKEALGTAQLLGMLFALCIGGAYGLEDAVGAGGPLLAIIFFVLLPFLWSLPTGLISCELATMVRSNAGATMWVNVAFPPWVSFFVMLLSIEMMCVGNAVTPNLFVDYIAEGVALSEGARVGLKIAACATTTLLNAIGVELVGRTSIISSLATLSPFLVVSFWQFFKSGGGVNWDRVSHVESDINWSVFLSIITWNFSYIEMAGTIAEEVKNPSKTFVRAMVGLSVAYVIAYALPILAGASAFTGSDWAAAWQAGYWSDIAEDIGGPWMKWYMLSMAALAAFGYLLMGQCCTSRSLAGMGDMNAFPKISAWLGEYDARTRTPINAILMNGMVFTCLSLVLSFRELVAINQAMYCIRLMIIYFAVIKLRFSFPNLDRPYKVPGSTTALVGFLAVPIALCVLTAVLSAKESVRVAMACSLNVGVALLLAILYTKTVRKDGFVGKVVEIGSELEAQLASSSAYSPVDKPTSDFPVTSDMEMKVKASADV